DPWFGQPETLAKGATYRRGTLAERGERPCRASQLPDEETWDQLVHAIQMTHRLVEEHGELQPQRRRDRVLAVGSSCHRRRSLLPNTPREESGQPFDAATDLGVGAPRLQDHPGVHDVLRRRPPVHVATCV